MIPDTPHIPDTVDVSSASDVLRVQDLVVTYGRHRAVDGVGFRIAPGESYAVVGESGCGKTTLARTVLGLLRPVAGEVALEGVRLDRARGRDLRALRRRVQIVFQNPFAALDPRMTVARLVDEPLRLAQPDLTAAGRAEAVSALLASVGLADRFLGRRPHELSGGQCQRVAIARALAMDPVLLVLDEPTSALDVSVQAQVLNLLADLRQRQGLAYLLISHDLGVVRRLADRIGVMHAGRLVEEGPAQQVLHAPSADYTRALIAAVPGRGRAALVGGAEAGAGAPAPGGGARADRAAGPAPALASASSAATAPASEPSAPSSTGSSQ
ncbi:ATP-binding cassette domain-containing protein [Kitasatospora phosalacinea]|uniref:ATP-binding cassette domain-containing protein n=1 Tax=Kitasatospora phosalacinea TaxID=2065 RepID=UPI000692405B|nr:ABC transporter ATP-binding protein [Kitasatospora phosalacinea]